MAQLQGLISLLQNRGNNEDSSIISQFSPIGSLIEGGPKGYANHYMLPFMLANLFNNDDQEETNSYQGGGLTNLGTTGSQINLGGPTSTMAMQQPQGGGIQDLLKNNPDLIAKLRQALGVGMAGGGYMEDRMNQYAVNPQGPGSSTIPLPTSHQFGGSYPSNVLTGQTYLPPPLAGSMFKTPSTSPSNFHANNTRPQSNYMNPSGVY